MIISRDEVRKIAHLARLEIDDSQTDKMAEQLSDILGYIDKLKDVNVEGVELASDAAFMNNVLREDEVKPSPGPGVTLANAPERDDDYFTVPRVVK
ncbi:MAG: Asp-tRNA(Asn)/Glu-tRNA(Gln) amidotransferase subunit GatC [Desulfobacterales bacterium]|nr:Asp-tRNA(Asn)/Glu-tRNA(Gln) amidotransferase subunit GatC [Desulfobacterales bacterium]